MNYWNRHDLHKMDKPQVITQWDAAVDAFLWFCIGLAAGIIFRTLL